MAELSAFHNVRFPLGVSFGATGGPERINEIVRMVSGRERRNVRFSQSRRRFDAGTGLRSLDDLNAVLAFFEARRGSLHAFRFRDPFDWASCRPGQTPQPLDQALGAGDGASRRFQLVKLYGEGADAYRREIKKPVSGTVRAAVDGRECAPGTFGVDRLTGLLEFAAAHTPSAGAAVTAGFEFDVAVRFDGDRIEASIASFKAGQIPSIPLVEVFA